MGIIMASVTGFPSPASAALVTVLLASGVYVIVLLSNVRHTAFAADAEGIRLGVRQNRPKPARRPPTRVPWSQILEIRVSPAPAGSTVDFVLATSAATAPARVMPAPLTFALVALPFSYRWQKPPLLCPLTNPPRYRVPLFDANATELASALRSLAPASVTIAELPQL